MVQGRCQHLTLGRPAMRALDSTRAVRSWCAAHGAQHRAQRVLHGQPPALEHVGVDLCGAHIRMPELFLHRADIRPALEKMGGEGVALIPISE